MKSLHNYVMTKAVHYDKTGFDKQVTVKISEEKNELIKAITSQCREYGLNMSRDDLIHIGLDLILDLVQDEHNKATFHFKDEEDNMLNFLMKNKRRMLELKVEYYEMMVKKVTEKEIVSVRDKINNQRAIEIQETNLRWAKAELRELDEEGL